jgi:hypothetical protein
MKIFQFDSEISISEQKRADIVQMYLYLKQKGSRLGQISIWKQKH